MNQIIVVTSHEYENIKNQINTTDTFLVEIEGNTIQTTNQLFDIMEQKYDLRTSDGTWGRNWAAFNDLMTDLDWINHDKHILTIKNYKHFMEKDKYGKELFEEYFRDSILPFWEEDVLRVVVEGETKEFTVYLVD